MFKMMLVMAFAMASTGIAQDGSSTTADTTEGAALLFGVGSRIAGPDVTNYKTTSSNLLETTNLGRATPQGLLGLGFPLCAKDIASTDKSNIQARKSNAEARQHRFCGNSLGNRLGVFVSAQFGTGTDQPLTGFTIGASVHVRNNLHFVAGFSMSPIDEPSPGFRNAAFQYVSSHLSQYAGIDPSALKANKPNAFDGFQYVIPPPAGSNTTGTPIYPGDVLTTHYRGGLFIGVAFPLKLRPGLEGKQ
jgi:hypothetical protein